MSAEVMDQLLDALGVANLPDALAEIERLRAAAGTHTPSAASADKTKPADGWFVERMAGCFVPTQYARRIPTFDTEEGAIAFTHEQPTRTAGELQTYAAAAENALRRIAEACGFERKYDYPMQIVGDVEQRLAELVDRAAATARLTAEVAALRQRVRGIAYEMGVAADIARTRTNEHEAADAVDRWRSLLLDICAAAVKEGTTDGVVSSAARIEALEADVEERKAQIKSLRADALAQNESQHKWRTEAIRLEAENARLREEAATRRASNAVLAETIVADDIEIEKLRAAQSAPSGLAPTRQHHLTWNGTEWVDDRCGCRFHPDDDNNTHGGGPHVHPCEQHNAALSGLDESGTAPGYFAYGDGTFGIEGGMSSYTHDEMWMCYRAESAPAVAAATRELRAERERLRNRLLAEVASVATAGPKRPEYEPQDDMQRLAYFIEECGETLVPLSIRIGKVLAAAGKTLRWGPHGYNPELPPQERETNAAWLLRETLDLQAAIDRALPMVRRLVGEDTSGPQEPSDVHADDDWPLPPGLFWVPPDADGHGYYARDAEWHFVWCENGVGDWQGSGGIDHALAASARPFIRARNLAAHPAPTVTISKLQATIDELLAVNRALREQAEQPRPESAGKYGRTITYGDGTTWPWWVHVETADSDGEERFYVTLSDEALDAAYGGTWPGEPGDDDGFPLADNITAAWRLNTAIVAAERASTEQDIAAHIHHVIGTQTLHWQAADQLGLVIETIVASKYERRAHEQMPAADKLRVYWNAAENCIGGWHPLGSQTRTDLGYLLHALKDIEGELERRGYDKRTLVLSIEPQAGNERFASQRQEQKKS